METKRQKFICKAVHSLANMMILFFTFFFAFFAVCCAVETMTDFNIWTFVMAVVSTAVWVYLLRFYKEER